VTVIDVVKHHGDLVAPGPCDCYCGMADEYGVVEGGDCRSLGCDPCCPACGGGPDDACPDPKSCGGYFARNEGLVRPRTALRG
jgi:hypothetical protein